MTAISDTLATAFDFLLVVAGFTLIIVVHELGHFVAARWAGIRVLAFAVGFGRAAVSYRAGLGWRRGSSEREFLALVGRGKAHGLSHTEYRLNWLPFGGYVKMLGQDDADPGARSDAPDSYQSCPPWKRMVVISAGVVMNIVLAVVLFMVVFMLGLRSEPALVGSVRAGSPAATAVALNGPASGVTEPGLRTGDEIIEVNGRPPRHFNDLMMSVVMSRKGDPVRLRVRRPGVEPPLEFSVLPVLDPGSRLLEIGVAPALSLTVVNPRSGRDRAALAAGLERMGLKGVEPGMTLVSVAGRTDLRDPQQIAAMLDAGHGAGMEFVFAAPGGREVRRLLTPDANLDLALVGDDEAPIAVEHLLGLSPVLAARRVVSPGAKAAGLRDGDVFVRLGGVDFPSVPAGITEIRAHKGRSVDAEVERDGPGGRERVTLSLPVNRKGQVGFDAGDTAVGSTLLSRTPKDLRALSGGPLSVALGEAMPGPGVTIESLNGHPTPTLAALREALIESTREAVDSGAASVNVEIVFTRPGPLDQPPVPETMRVSLAREDLLPLRELGWGLDLDLAIFEPRWTTVKARTPWAAVGVGLAETHRVMMSTYLTFARLFQGTVRVEHLKGPVGIAHLGTRIAERGFIWLMFFLALISVNLAVINFLPLPIVDGGQFLMILYEQVRGRAMPIAVQNLMGLAGLALVGVMFLVVTYNDLARLFGG